MALGAGAGAHRGDMDRDKVALEARRLQQQQQQHDDRMRQQDRQFDLNLNFQRSRIEDDKQRFSVAREDQLAQNKHLMSRNKELDLMNKEERDFSRSRLKQADELAVDGMAHTRAREEKKDAWADALNVLATEKQIQEMEKNNILLEQYRMANKEVADQIANRENVVKSNFSALLMSAMENGGIASPKALEVYNKTAGGSIRGLVFTDNGGVLIREEGRGEDGNPVVEDRFLEQQFVDTVKNHFLGAGDGRQGRPAGRVAQRAATDLKADAGTFDTRVAGQALSAIEKQMAYWDTKLAESLDMDSEDYKNGAQARENLRQKYERITDRMVRELLGDSDPAGAKSSTESATQKVKVWKPSSRK